MNPGTTSIFPSRSTAVSNPLTSTNPGKYSPLQRPNSNTTFINRPGTRSSPSRHVYPISHLLRRKTQHPAGLNATLLWPPIVAVDPNTSLSSSHKQDQLWRRTIPASCYSRGISLGSPKQRGFQQLWTMWTGLLSSSLRRESRLLQVGHPPGSAEKGASLTIYCSFFSLGSSHCKFDDDQAPEPDQGSLRQSQ